MRTKKFKFLSVLMTGLFLVGCYRSEALPKSFVLGGNLPKGFMENNRQETPDTIFTGYTTVKELDEYQDVVGAPAGSFSKVNVALNGKEYFGVYDFYSDREIIAPTYTEVLLGSYNFYNYFKGGYETLRYAIVEQRTQDTKELGVYSLTENKFIVALSEYNDYGINITPDLLNNSGNLEEITMYRESDAVLFKYNVDFDKNGNIIRQSLRSEDSGYVEAPTYMKIPQLPKLKDFTYNLTNDKIEGFKNGKKVFEVILPGDLINDAFMIDKYLYTQIITQVPSEAKKFTFFNGGQKYLLETSRIDLTSGAVRNYRNFSYIFASMIPQKDKDGEFTLARGQLRKIEDYILLSVAEVLVDKNLKPLVNLTQKGFSPNYIKIAANRYLTSNRKIVDENYEVILDLSNYTNVQYIPEHDVISLAHGGNYGLINREGKIIIPFKYTDGSFRFYNGYAINYNSVIGKYERISYTGTVAEIYEYNYQVNIDPLYSEAVGGGAVYKNRAGDILFTLTATETVISSRGITGGKFNVTIGVLLVIRNSSTNKTRYLIVK